METLAVGGARSTEHYEWGVTTDELNTTDHAS